MTMLSIPITCTCNKPIPFSGQPRWLPYHFLIATIKPEHNNTLCDSIFLIKNQHCLDVYKTPNQLHQTESFRRFARSSIRNRKLPNVQAFKYMFKQFMQQPAEYVESVMNFIL